MAAASLDHSEKTDPAVKDGVKSSDHFYDHPRKRRKTSPDTAEDESPHTASFQPASRIKHTAPSGTQPPASVRKSTILNGKLVDSESSFASLGIDPWLLTSLSALSVLRPTPIQKACIPAILQGADVIGGSRTGTGKTIAFAAPLLQKWAEDPIGIFAVILTPTRELALQIQEQFRAIGVAQSLKPVIVIGGEDMRTQALALASRPHLVIATPGRLADHIATSGQDTTIGLRRVKIVVLDEADRLLASGPGSMLEDVGTCLGALPPSHQRQTCLFTATVTPEVMALKDKPRPPDRPPIFVCEVAAEEVAIPSTLTQTYLQVPISYKEAYLHVLLGTAGNLSMKSLIVFCNRTSTADLIERLLRSLEHRVTSLHSRLPQRDRVDNLARFRAGAARILVASDVASRGLDIPSVDLVINYDVPRNPDDYVHRVGRTARAGKAGGAVTLVGQPDVALFLAIEQRVGSKMGEWNEEGVNVETRVARDGLKQVGDIKRRVELDIEEDRDILGRRRRGRVKRLE